jgi:hypothetical protein
MPTKLNYALLKSFWNNRNQISLKEAVYKMLYHMMFKNYNRIFNQDN